MRVCLQHFRNFEKLHQIEAPFATLILTDERLGPAESVSKGSLRQATLGAGLS
jgi:hypothetical protein